MPRRLVVVPTALIETLDIVSTSGLHAAKDACSSLVASRKCRILWGGRLGTCGALKGGHVCPRKREPESSFLYNHFIPKCTAYNNRDKEKTYQVLRTACVSK